MKTRLFFIPTFLLLTFFWSCEIHNEEGNINLNNGEKWQVNSEMTPHIEKSNAMLDEFVNNESKDYKQLALNLKDQNNALIQSCTMKGESHDELHKWLHPHIELINELSAAESPEAAEATIKKLEDSFETYHSYFE